MIKRSAVDKNDILIALYRVFIRLQKWTLRASFHYFNNLAVCNSWLEHQHNMIQSGQQFHMDLLQFTTTVLESLTFSGYSVSTSRRGRPLSATSSPRNSPVPIKRQKPNTVPVDYVRLDNIGHWPIQCCKLESCTGPSRIQ